MGAEINGVTFTTIAEALAMLPYPLPIECDGEPVALEFARSRDSQLLRWGPPRMPGREVWEYRDGDDEPHYVRDCTEEEIAARNAAYEAELAEWHRTQGMVRTTGPIRDTAKVRMVGGKWYELIGDGAQWYVTAVGHDR